MKNPTKLLGLINNISNKINSKMKDGSLKESELLEEATNIFKDMKNVPGMGNFNDIFKSMNLDQFMPKGGKINPNAFQSMMEQNVKMSKMKDRIEIKLIKINNPNILKIIEKSESIHINASLKNLSQQMDNNNDFK